jgi:hypothetical protein
MGTSTIGRDCRGPTDVRELRKGVTLGGLRVEELINEGRNS